VDPTGGLVGRRSEVLEVSWTERDTMLYALGVGAGVDHLALTTESSAGHPLTALPTMALVLGDYGAAALRGVPGLDPARVVHGEQGLAVHRTLPTSGALLSETVIDGVHDKGSGALITLTTEARDAADGQPLFTSRIGAFVRGWGGFGGEGGPSARHRPPKGEPTATVRYVTTRDQALLYRLSGDLNPLHSDPVFAARAGYPRPILHGLCTLGFAGRALVAALCDGDPTRATSIEGRFTSPVVPGDELVTRIWTLGAGLAQFTTVTGAGTIAIDRGVFGFDPGATGLEEAAHAGR
jgi:acyl dehydratase